MVRNVFVLLLVFVCAIYLASAFPDLRLNALKKWVEEDQVLERVERGFRGRGRPGGRGRGRGRGGRGGGRGGWRGGRPGGRGRGGRRGDSSDCEDDGSTAGQQGDPTTKPPTTKPPTTKPPTTTTTTTTTSTTTTTPKPTDPLDFWPADDANLAPAESELGCIIAHVPYTLMAPNKISCAQILQLTDVARYFAHTECGWYCQCDVGLGGAKLQKCPQYQAWDAELMTCTPEAYEKC